MSAETPLTVNEPGFWQGLYERGGDRWELGQSNPSLVDHLQRNPLPLGDVAVLGCGRGHDARLLARLGYRVWGFDFAPEAIQTARALAEREGLEIVFEPRDIFDLATDYAGFFDGAWEYTCYCAIQPARRPEYVELVARILKPGGWLLACFFPVRESAPAEGPDVPTAGGSRRPGETMGPPFPTSEAEVRRLFAPRFSFGETYPPEVSAPGRQGLEWMVRARLTLGA